jgi:hypothetical protein
MAMCGLTLATLTQYNQGINHKNTSPQERKESRIQEEFHGSRTPFCTIFKVSKIFHVGFS